MADINRLMQIVNALEAQGTDVEGMLGGMLTPAPMAGTPVRPDDYLPPVPMAGTPVRPDDYLPPVPMGQTFNKEEMLAEIKRRRMGMDQAPAPTPDLPPGMTMDQLMEIRRRMMDMNQGPGMGSISQGEMGMMQRRMPGQGQSRSGILELLQRMR